MTVHSTICPYTGLRSFTEEESLYFKGRDLQVDQITSLLEQNKFLMVTGASGEGKSSLIYAGLIPNARAGFFKAKYTNWVVADFRPERNPVHNMADALAKSFGRNTATVETELRRGFSSLVDLYTSSDFYVEESDENWLQAGEAERKERKRKAANLLVLVDQFEEFFTNPENFYRDAPTQDSQVVVNLVLETARIAIKRNIPVYIVCTMRSDYIGQCSAFRGLPEYIGFSQFFVPRLKRKDMKQVIEEPAILSGNRISQRLIERLVFDVAEGLDQLPILQHALSQVWLAADKGRQEMDLIHYAKVGGMPAEELPDADQLVFRKWMEELPEARRKYYQDTGLQKVIEIHASVLYENAWDRFHKQHPDHPLTRQEAKRIIALTFSCLTKIDNSRAVRNRMTLGEITSIINSPNCTQDVVSEVLGIYREEGNSFIRPFLTSDPATHTLSGDTVLDITHESLIRNWNKLNTWASQEYEFYTTYLDFTKQMDRWKASRKSSGYLLPIGPLTYFENWYNKCRPNTGWIRRYAEAAEDSGRRAGDADTILADIREFLKRSARKVAITRAFMKYGPQRIATVFAIGVMLLLIGYYWYDAERKQNSRVIQQVRKDILSLMKKKEVGWDLKAAPLIILDMDKPGSMREFLSGLEIRDRFKLEVETIRFMQVTGKKDSMGLQMDLVRMANEDLRNLLAGKPDFNFLLPVMNRFSSLLAVNHYYNPDTASGNLLREIAGLHYRVVQAFYRDSSLYRNTVSPEINYSIQLWLSYGEVKDTMVKELLQLISPFETVAGKRAFAVYYPKGRKESNASVTNVYSGGYQNLASLYAVIGDSARVTGCLDSVRKAGNNEYFTGITLNNPSHILIQFYQFDHADKAASLLNWVSSRYPAKSALEIYKEAVNRSGYLVNGYRAAIDKNFGLNSGYFFPSACLFNRELFGKLADAYEQRIQQVQQPAEKNYLLAIQKKRRALYQHKYCFDRQLPVDTASLRYLLDEAIASYRRVDPNYLEQTVPVLTEYNYSFRTYTYKRKQLFLYPDYMDGWIVGTYQTDLFFRYLSRNDLFTELYKTPEDLGFIHLWLAKANTRKLNLYQDSWDNRYPLDNDIPEKILALERDHPAGKGIDKNLPVLLLANRAFDRGDTVSGMRYYQLFDRDKYYTSRDKYDYLEKTFFLNQMKDLCVNLAFTGRKELAVDLAERMELDYQKVFAYILMSRKLYEKQADPEAFVYLDSALAKHRVVEASDFDPNAENDWDYRMQLVLLMSRIGGKHLNGMTAKLFTQFLEDAKFVATQHRIEGVAAEGNYYRAISALPSTLTEQEDLFARLIIFLKSHLGKGTEAEKQRWEKLDEWFSFSNNYIAYYPY